MIPRIERRQSSRHPTSESPEACSGITWSTVSSRVSPPAPGSILIRLTFHDPADRAAAELEASDIRITGGVLWNHVEHGLIACFASGAWKHLDPAYVP